MNHKTDLVPPNYNSGLNTMKIWHTSDQDLLEWD